MISCSLPTSLHFPLFTLAHPTKLARYSFRAPSCGILRTEITRHECIVLANSCLRYSDDGLITCVPCMAALGFAIAFEAVCVCVCVCVQTL